MSLRTRFAVMSMLVVGSALADSGPVARGAPPTTDGRAGAEATLFILADNQERYLYGAPTFYSEIVAQKASPVAIRSTDQDLFAKFTTQAAFDRIEKDLDPRTPGRVPAPIVHLGDLLDYSCAAEYEALRKLPWLANDRLTVAPGNHDGLFQGNGTYGGALGEAWLRVKKVLNPRIDPTLEGHHDDVCALPKPVIPLLAPRGWSSDLADAKNASWSASMDELRRKRGGTAKDTKRDHIDAREQPHHIRCELLELTYKDALPQQAKEYCEDMLVRRYFSVKGAAPNLHGPVSAKMSTYGRQALFDGGPSPMTWDSGFLVQRIEVPLTNAGSNTGEVVLVILLDTQGWQSKPSGKTLSRDDATVGTIGERQKTAVAAWLGSLKSSGEGRVAAVILAGHYPLKEMTRSSVEWIAGLQRVDRRVLPLYISAHTHLGYLKPTKAANDEIWEINVGSLIDFPAHFRDLQLIRDARDEGWTIRSRAYFMREELACRPNTPERWAAYSGGCKRASEFLGKSNSLLRSWTVLDPRPQYCIRLAAASETLRSANQAVPDLNAQLCAKEDHSKAHVDAFSARAATSVDALTRDVAQESNRMRDTGQSTGLAPKLACAALGGSEIFNINRDYDHPPGEIVLSWHRTGSKWTLASSHGQEAEGKDSPYEDICPK